MGKTRTVVLKFVSFVGRDDLTEGVQRGLYVEALKDKNWLFASNVTVIISERNDS